MSRHIGIEEIRLCASSSSVNVDWSQFVETIPAARDLSPIDSFYKSHEDLNRLAVLTADSEHVDADIRSPLGGQLLLGYVSATELYLRQAIAKGVEICPIIRKKNRSQQIPFGALDYYERETLAHALTERVSFSEPGTIKNQLEQRLGVKVKQNSSLARSIEDFERVCQLRHALVHSHGVINSSNAALLIGVAKSARVSIDLRCLQWVAGIVMNLVRDANSEIARTIVWEWVVHGHLIGDARKDQSRIRRLLRSFGSEVDRSAQRGISSEAELKSLVRQAVADIS